MKLQARRLFRRPHRSFYSIHARFRDTVLYRRLPKYFHFCSGRTAGMHAAAALPAAADDAMSLSP